MINIDELIKNAMKSGNKTELQAYRNLKAEFQKFKTAKNAKPYDETSELTIISKYCKSLEDAIEQFSEAHRDDLIASYTSELEVLKKLLPASVDESEIYCMLDIWCEDNNFRKTSNFEIIYEIPKKEMGNAIKYLKSKFPTADGKMISDIVKEYVI